MARLCVLLCFGCSGEPASSPVRGQSHGILGAQPAPGRSGVVSVEHRDRLDVCTGTTIAPRLVVTAKHCAFRQLEAGDEPLPVDGFRIGFGPDEARFQLRYATALEWVGAPDERDVLAAVAAGEDVALLELDRDAPEGAELTPVRVSYRPGDGDPVAIAGFGLTSLQTGTAGVRTEADAQVAGFDPGTGVLQLEGAPACFGDSGGPVLFGDPQALVAVIGRVATDGDGDGGYCDDAITLASSIANDRVRAMLLQACRRMGGCGPRAKDDQDAGVEPADTEPPPPGDAGASGPRPSTPVDASPDAAPESDADPHDSGCACTAPGRPPGAAPATPWLLALLALRLRRRRHLSRAPTRRL